MFVFQFCRVIVKKPPQPLPEADLPVSPDVITASHNGSSVALKIAMAATNGGDVKFLERKTKEVVVTSEKLDARVEFPAAEFPTRTDFTLVPTYVDYNCVVYGQEVKPGNQHTRRLRSDFAERFVQCLEMISRRDTYRVWEVISWRDTYGVWEVISLRDTYGVWEVISLRDTYGVWEVISL